MTRAKLSLVVLGVVTSTAFLGYAFSELDWPLFVQAIATIKYSWVVASLAALLATMVLRAMRWHIITGLPAQNFIDVWDAASVGYMGTAILPARAGEVLRVIRLQRLPNITAAAVVGSSIIDRLFDGLGLCLLIGPTLWIVASQIELTRYLLVVAGGFAAIAILVAVFVVFGGRLSLRSTRGGIGRFVSRWSAEAHAGLQALREPRKLLLLVFLLLVTCALDVTACWLLLLAFGLELPLSAALVFLVLLAIATTLPSTPGYIGVYQVAAIAALQGFGVDSSEAVAFGTVLQVASFLLFVIVGLFAYRRRAGDTASAG